MATTIPPGYTDRPTVIATGANRRMLAARVVVIALIAVSLVIFVVSVPVSIHQAATSVDATQLGGGTLGFAGPGYAVFRAVVDILISLAFLVIAAMLMVRRRDDWFVLFVALTLGLTGFNYSDGFYALYVRTWPPQGITLVVGGLAALAEITQLMAFFLFPDGQFKPTWTRWLLMIWVPFRLAGWLYVYLTPLRAITRPYDLALQFIFFGIGIAAQVFRYRSTTSPEQRQQTKWIIFGMSAATLSLLVYVSTVDAIPTIARPGTARLIYVVAGAIVTRSMLLLVPASVAASILRYRLWDVDFIISRSLVYGALTALVVALFGGSLVVLDQLFRSMSGGQQSAIAIAFSGLVFGIVFQPARRLLQRFVDRRFYHIAIDYERVAQKEREKQQTPSGGPRKTHIGKFHDLQLVARGGMAEIYRGVDPDLKRPVAIKVLQASLAKENDFRKRFEREARVISQLRHPNIVRAYEFGQTEGLFFMVMEFVDGQTLSDRIRTSTPMPLAEVRDIIANIASALDYAHKQGLVHRDIKPSNVMLETVTLSKDQRGLRAVLMDFGIARIVGGETQLTQTAMMGTLDYISPEQIHDAKDVDGRADVYSLGIVLYQMLTGELPFKMTTPAALLMAHLFEPTPDPRHLRPEVPESFSDAVRKATEKNREYRFETAGELVEALLV